MPRRDGIAVRARAGGMDAGHCAVEIDVPALPAGAPDAELFVAVTEGPLRVDVRRGENAGRALVHTAVARALSPLGRVQPAGMTARTTLATRPGASLRAVVFVQESRSRKVLGIGVATLPAST